MRQSALAVLRIFVVHITDGAALRHDCIATLDDGVLLCQKPVAYNFEDAAHLSVEGRQDLLKDLAVHLHDLLG